MAAVENLMTFEAAAEEMDFGKVFHIQWIHLTGPCSLKIKLKNYQDFIHLVGSVSSYKTPRQIIYVII